MGVSNLFELAVATSIALFGFRLSMALGTVVGNARHRYTPEQWPMPETGKATREIYNELRHLDLKVVRMGVAL